MTAGVRSVVGDVVYWHSDRRQWMYARVNMDIDESAVMAQLGGKAGNTKSKEATAMYGGIKVALDWERPAHQSEVKARHDK